MAQASPFVLSLLLNTLNAPLPLPSESSSNQNSLILGQQPIDCRLDCNNRYLPVCGSDGVTYHNLCYLIEASCVKTIQLVKLSPCECSTIRCKYEYHPVCGSDDVTYPNYCFFTQAACVNASLTIVKSQPCVLPDPCKILCSRILDPVCGSNGVTYNNPCLLMYASCYYTGQGIVKSHDGRCHVPDPCASKGCTREYLPVCGSDGMTYSNDCTFRQKACSDPSLTKVKDAACDDNTGVVAATQSPSCPGICTRRLNPVCGSDGRTYSNICLMKKASCTTNQAITLVNMGACGNNVISSPNDTPCPLACSRQYAPVCGSNGIMYDNICLLTRVACKDNSVFQVSDGFCAIPDESDSCPEVCPFIHDPICGSNGVTYTNNCTFSMAACNDGALTMVHRGSCF